MDDSEHLARIFKALSADSRIQILLHLKEGMLCVGALASRLEMSPSAVSQHLRVLRDADLVVPEKEGYYVHYRLNTETLREWRRVTNDLLTPEEQ